MNSEAQPGSTRWTKLLLVALALAAGCGGATMRRFPQREPMWEDPDRQPFAPKPEEYFSPFGWDAADQTIFRPISRFFAVDPGREAVNVNAMDEVPDSSWFENRIGMREMSPERFARAACEQEPPDPEGPWTVTSAKPGGANAGFVMQDQEGRRYVTKLDLIEQPERASAADVIGSVFYWAAGYHAPCNQVVLFDRAILRIGEDATAETDTGEEVPLTEDHLDEVFRETLRLKDGRHKMMVSRFLEGEPLGPWRYQGTRDDDPNDVVPHQDRRELRGAYVLASWINHFDSREQNTLSTWMKTEDGEKGWVRHNYLDFGDSLGSIWFSWPSISRRLGRAYYLDIPYMMEDLLTLGLIERPWERVEYGPTGQTLGYFADLSVFEPEDWRPGYPNPAFGRKTERDAAWMARVIAQMTPEHVRAAIEKADIVQPLLAQELLRVLLGRREKILERWLRDLSPLTHPVVLDRDGAATLCLRDLAVDAELIAWDERPYRSRAWLHRRPGAGLEPIARGALVRRMPDRVCVGLPAVDDATPAEPAYLIVDVTGLYGEQDERSRPARVHLYQTGPGDYRIVGLERPYEADAPGS